MDTKQLQEVLAQHKLWLEDSTKGKRANLREADLRRADLRGADLRRADLRGADLCGADLCGADLREADLRRADLRRADLRGDDLRGADLCGADLRRADLRGADLRGADLRGVDLRRAKLNQSIVPEIGEFTAFKKLQNDVIATLLIPANAARVGGLLGRKCRAEFVKVLKLSKGKKGYGMYNKENPAVYEVGKITKPDKWDGDIRVECTHGIHFFMTKQEAKDFIL